MKHQIKIKPPSGFKELTGWSIRTIGSPFLGAAITYFLMLKVEWQINTRILFGVFIAFPWFWMVSRWLLVPLWNNLYLPIPDLPVDEGVIESNIYIGSNEKKFLRGLGFDIIDYTHQTKDTKLSSVRMSNDEFESLTKIDETLKLHYSFVKYREGYVRMSYYRNTPQFGYKWPVYEYKILSNSE